MGFAKLNIDCTKIKENIDIIVLFANSLHFREYFSLFTIVILGYRIKKVA